MNWKPIDDENPPLGFVLTRRLRKFGPDHIVSARRLPGAVTVKVWQDTDGNTIPVPNEYAELPE